MNKKFLVISAFLCFFGLAAPAQAISITFNFTGECDDCAFNGTPGGEGFDPLNDGLTQTVNATLTLDGLSVVGDMIDYRGAGSVIFSYGGSSLLNPFTMADPYLFTDGLLTDGTVAPGFEFTLSSTENYADPANPLSFDFPNFCTPLGEQVLGSDCEDAGDISFHLDSAGLWSISVEAPADIGTNGQLSVAGASAVPVPGALLLFSSGLLGLLGFTRSRAARQA